MSRLPPPHPALLPAPWLHPGHSCPLLPAPGPVAHRPPPLPAPAWHLVTLRCHLGIGDHRANAGRGGSWPGIALPRTQLGAACPSPGSLPLLLGAPGGAGWDPAGGEPDQPCSEGPPGFNGQKKAHAQPQTSPPRRLSGGNGLQRARGSVAAACPSAAGASPGAGKAKAKAKPGQQQQPRRVGGCGEATRRRQAPAGPGELVHPSRETHTQQGQTHRVAGVPPRGLSFPQRSLTPTQG